MVNKKLIFKVIKALESFFNEEQALSLSLHSLRNQGKNNLLHIEIIFNYQLLNTNNILEGSQVSYLFRDTKLDENFMNCSTIYAVSDNLIKLLKLTDTNEETAKYLNFFTGVHFYKDNWREIGEKVFAEYFQEYFTTQLKKELESKIKYKKLYFKKLKI